MHTYTYVHISGRGDQHDRQITRFLHAYIHTYTFQDVVISMIDRLLEKLAATILQLNDTDTEMAAAAR